ncbi:MAG: 50S ribosomal protein L28 [Bryobacteraceae bacterium]
MSRVCELTGKRPSAGRRVSHANNKSSRWFLPNLHKKRFFLPSENRWVTLKVSAGAIRTIDKLGIEAVIADLRKKGQKA